MSFKTLQDLFFWNVAYSAVLQDDKETDDKDSGGFLRLSALDLHDISGVLSSVFFLELWLLNKVSRNQEIPLKFPGFGADPSCTDGSGHWAADIITWKESKW